MLHDQQGEGFKRLDRSINSSSRWLSFFYRAWLKVLRRDLPGALEDLERGLEISPFDRSLLSTRAFFTLYQGRLEDADALACAGHKVRDDVDGLWLVRSIAATEMGDFRHSCIYGERAASLMAQDRKSIAYLAYAYAAAGLTSRARDMLSGIGPGKNGHTPSFLAAPYLALGDTREAIRIVQVARHERCPNRAVTWCDPRLKDIWPVI